MLFFLKIRISVLVFILVGLCQAADDVTLCSRIAEDHLRSIPRLADASLGDVVQDPYAFYNFLTTTITTPHQYDARRCAFKILDNAEQKSSLVWAKQSLIDQTTWQDLSLLYGSKDNPSVHLAHILSQGRTRTEIGRAYLYGLLARPTPDVELLMKRQEIVKRLIDNEQVFQDLDALLCKIATHETLLTGLWDTELLMQFVQGNYIQMSYIGQAMNKSSICLDIKSLLQWSALGVSVGILAISPVVLTLYGFSMLYKGDPVMTSWADSCFGQVGLAFKAFPVLKNRWVQGIVALLVGFGSTFALKNTLQGTHVNLLLDNFLRQRLVHVALYEEAASNLVTTIAQSASDIGVSLAFYSDMQNFFDDYLSDADLVHLKTLLATTTFQKGSEDEFSLFFRRGNMLVAYYILSTIKQRFEALMAGVGELDAFLTIAKLVKESNNMQATWCFPSYVMDVQTPSLELRDFWNPFLDQDKVVCNTINLGEVHGIAHLTVTGPNSAGKSTILKSIALSVVMAQSVGIAPALRMSLTAFSYLVTYMNVTDSIVDQESRFQAEARRVFEYGDKLKELEHNQQFSFALFDEIFSGTSPEEGAELGYKVALALARYRFGINIIATHYKKLTDLEDDTHGKFVNYKVSVEENEDGSLFLDTNNNIKRLFTLTPGRSHQHIAREIFKERGNMGQSDFFQSCFDTERAKKE